MFLYFYFFLLFRFFFFFFLMIRRPPRSTLFPSRRSSDLDPRQWGKPLTGDKVGLWRYRIGDRKSTRLNSRHSQISYAVFFLKKKKTAHLVSLFYLYRLRQE